MEKKYVIAVLVSVAFWGGAIFFTKQNTGKTAFSVEGDIGSTEADKTPSLRPNIEDDVPRQEQGAQVENHKGKQQALPKSESGSVRRLTITRSEFSGPDSRARGLAQEIIFEEQTGAVPKEKIQRLKEMVEANDPTAIEETRLLLDQVTNNAIQHELLRTLARNSSAAAMEGITEVMEKKKNEPTEVSRILSYIPLGAHRELPPAIVDELHGLMQHADLEQQSHKVIANALLQRGGAYGRELYQVEMKKK